MTLRFVLDTNVVSELVRPVPDAAVASKIASAVGTMAVAAPTLHELRFGVERLAASRRKTMLEAYFDRFAETFAVLPYDRAAALWHARERARLAALGRVPSFVDGQIAAVAATGVLVLVTQNVRDFARYDGLTVECWHG